jgi:hypothetical protein
MPTDKSNKKNGSADTSAPTDTIVCIRWEAAVREGKDILAAEKHGQWRLGELAANVEKKYGDRTLAKLAEEIGSISACTLERHQSVYNAWKDAKPALGPVSYSVLRALQNHPDRVNIVKERPNLTQAQARELMRPYRGQGSDEQEQDKEEESDWDKHNRRWFKNLVKFAQDARSAAEVALECEPEKQRELLKAVEPGLVMYLRGSGKTLVELADLLDELLEEAAEAILETQDRPVTQEPAHVVA